MSSGFEYVQHPRRTLPPPIPSRKGPAAAFLPGTFHPINPKNIAANHDQVLLSGWGKFVRFLLVIAAIVVIIVGINLILDGVYGFGTFSTSQMYRFATDPLIGVLIGILATAVVQSSTTTTTLAVTAVGTGLVSVPVAIPIIMGANIGTTITGMLVAFSYMGERREFKKAFATAAMHFWFNVILVGFMFVIEQLFHPLRTISGLVAAEVAENSGGTLPTSSFMTKIFDPLVNLIGMTGLIGRINNEGLAAVLCLVVGTVFILVAVRVMSTQIRTITAATATNIMDKVIDPENSLKATVLSNLSSFGLGLLFTLLVTASSVTVASMQPVAVSGRVKPRPVLAVILGANVGTTVTALFATLAIVGDLGEFAVQAALVHILMNVAGAIIVLCIPQLADLIIKLARSTESLVSRSYTIGLITIGVLFIVIPASVLLMYVFF
ncbi:Na+/phosphate symporter [Corynebacterium deserti GIMN1.010]|uniref:Na+/phosphate symporter n=1 Tax=Corynebacterium deserti GIMN1.010 TaxID=931089 RepID=A0A0M3QA39_9CORY|nr:Na/Pi symporter [Corynebacterium deserti]ALC06819.1 Na+/phosphate symporter [Corynebacterium deserti GIMN1.010]